MKRGKSFGREWTHRLRETVVRHCAPAENSPQVCCQTRTCSEKVQHAVCRYGPCYRSPFFLSLAARLHWLRAVLRAWTRLGRKNIRNADDFMVRGILCESRENQRLTSILRESCRLVCVRLLLNRGRNDNSAPLKEKSCVLSLPMFGNLVAITVQRFIVLAASDLEKINSIDKLFIR